MGLVAIIALVPAETWQRMSTMMPTKGQIGATSNEMREETLERAWQVAQDYPVFGVGLGNFREVTRQVYKDDFFRPPHNSYLWAICEGGIFVLVAYLYLFWVTWKDIAGHPPARAPGSGDRGLGHRPASRIPPLLLLFRVRRSVAEPDDLCACSAS